MRIRKIKYGIIVFLLLMAIRFNGWSQDIHFSQYFNSPLSLSPANTGNFPGDWRISANYRTQWKQVADRPYLTNSIGFDRQFYLYNEKLSGGLFVISDKSSATLQVLKIMLSAAYHKTILGHELHGGIQAGYVRKSFKINEETYPNQLNWKVGKFDPSLPNNESFLREDLSYVDLNLGLGWNKRFTDKIEPFLGIAFFHLNFPKETFQENGDNRLKPRTLINAGVRWGVGEKITIVPSFLWMGTTAAAEYLVGSNLEYMLEANTNPVKTKYIYGGVHLRTGYNRTTDAGYAVVGLKYANYNVGISYDINISSLHIATDYRGALEIAFIYTGISTRLTKTEIPCDRY